MSSSEMPAAWRCKHGVLTGLQGLTVIARRAEAMGSSEGAGVLKVQKHVILHKASLFCMVKR